ncbi:MAG: hypothetical protein RDV41_14270 [Planctomycetota bacterium]|nr:hypothetical protein [Planctomycetota bacterium]
MKRISHTCRTSWNATMRGTAGCKALCVAFVAMFILSACGGSTRLLLSREHAAEAGIGIGRAAAVDTDGAVFLADGSQVVRFDPDDNSVEDILNEPAGGITDIAFAEDGVLLILQGAQLGAFFGGKVIPVTDAPAYGEMMSVYGRSLYAALRDSAGAATLFQRYELDRRYWSPLMRSDTRISAICGVRGGCLFAVGDSVFKLFEAVPGTKADACQVVLLCAVAGAEITSVVADEASEAVFFADADMTYAWAKGGVYPFFPVGGSLRMRAGKLHIISQSTAQIVRIGSPRSRLNEIIEGTAAEEPPR